MEETGNDSRESTLREDGIEVDKKTLVDREGLVNLSESVAQRSGVDGRRGLEEEVRDESVQV